jgi:hypothetical protein
MWCSAERSVYLTFNCISPSSQQDVAGYRVVVCRKPGSAQICSSGGVLLTIFVRDVCVCRAFVVLALIFCVAGHGDDAHSRVWKS